MISHDYKCIFLHIPRTGGTSMETWIGGQDLWNDSPAEKHLTALQAKDLYKQYWNSYFKFSVVRNPIQRFISMLKYADYFGVKTVEGNRLDISGYIERFGSPLPLEYDYRFVNRDLLQRLAQQDRQFSLRASSLYRNTLGDELQRVYRFEELTTKAVPELAEILGLDPSTFPHEEDGDPLPKITVDESTEALALMLHSNDLPRYGLTLK